MNSDQLQILDQLQIFDVAPPISTRYGWCAYVERQLTPPPRWSIQDIESLSSRQRALYMRVRTTWNAEINVASQQGQDRLDDFALILDANQHEAGQVRPPILLDALPGLGKTRLVKAFAADFHDQESALFEGHPTELGVRLPVAYVSLSSSTTQKTLNSMLARFYDVEGLRGRTATDLGHIVSHCVHGCGTRLIIIDDIHLLNMERQDARDVGDHLKWLASELPATFAYVGVGLDKKGLLEEGLLAENAHTAQIARRTTSFPLRPFTLHGKKARTEWARVLNAIEKRVVLANLPEGRLAVDLAEYLMERSTGHFQSLMSLLTRGFAAAMRNGSETVTKDSLEKITIDAAAEKNRRRLLDAIENGEVVTKSGVRSAA